MNTIEPGHRRCVVCGNCLNGVARQARVCSKFCRDERAALRSMEWREQRGPEKMKEHWRVYRLVNKEHLNKQGRERRRKNREDAVRREREYRRNHAERIRETARARGIKNREKLSRLEKLGRHKRSAVLAALRELQLI